MQLTRPDRQAGSMRLNLLLQQSIHAIYGRIQMNETPKRLKSTPLMADIHSPIDSFRLPPAPPRCDPPPPPPATAPAPPPPVVSTSRFRESSLSALFLPLRLSMSTSELSPPPPPARPPPPPPQGDLEPSRPPPGGRLGDCEALELSSGGVSDILKQVAGSFQIPGKSLQPGEF